VILFDGVCALCNTGVEWIRARDRDGRFEFVPYQSVEDRYPELDLGGAGPRAPWHTGGGAPRLRLAGPPAKAPRDYSHLRLRKNQTIPKAVANMRPMAVQNPCRVLSPGKSTFMP
jgi:hypothetical protein